MKKYVLLWSLFFVHFGMHLSPMNFPIYINWATELSETQNYAYLYARFFPGTHDFR